MRILLSIWLTSVFTLTFGQVETKDDSLEIWTVFSTGDFINENAHNIASEKWPFKTVSKAGDAFTDEFSDSIEIHNNQIWNYLDANGYFNSERSYYSDFQEERNRIATAVELSISNKSISEVIEKIRSDKLMNYTELTKLNDFEYEFIIYSFSPTFLEIAQKLELRYVVDLRKSKIKIIEL